MPIVGILIRRHQD